MTLLSGRLPDLPHHFKSRLKGGVCPDLHPPSGGSCEAHVTPPSPVWVSLRAEGGCRASPHFRLPLQGPPRRKEPGPSLGHRRAVPEDGVPRGLVAPVSYPRGGVADSPEHPRAFWFAPKSLGPACLPETHTQTHTPMVPARQARPGSRHLPSGHSTRGSRGTCHRGLPGTQRPAWLPAHLRARPLDACTVGPQTPSPSRPSTPGCQWPLASSSRPRAFRSLVLPASCPPRTALR